MLLLATVALSICSRTHGQIASRTTGAHACSGMPNSPVLMPPPPPHRLTTLLSPRAAGQALFVMLGLRHLHWVL